MLRCLIVCSALFLATACGAADPAPVSPTASDEAPPTPTAGPPQLAEGVMAMETTCIADADERCDALDSDCDGRIDEGCDGATSGALDVAVAWNGVADVDLSLTGPGAAEAEAVQAGACGDGDPRIERRTLASAPAGRYEVALRQADRCGGEGPVTASVTVSVGGRVLGTFNREVPPGESAPVVAFDVE